MKPVEGWTCSRARVFRAENRFRYVQRLRPPEASPWMGSIELPFEDQKRDRQQRKLGGGSSNDNNSKIETQDRAAPCLRWSVRAFKPSLRQDLGRASQPASQRARLDSTRKCGPLRARTANKDLLLPSEFLAQTRQRAAAKLELADRGCHSEPERGREGAKVSCASPPRLASKCRCACSSPVDWRPARRGSQSSLNC